jgi:D-lactate dehydrogenase (cytochrome)
MPASGDEATVGGMIATDASGTETVKYGEFADRVLGMEAVLADGTVIEVGSRAAKTSSGYNLADLLVGSEGTLAVVTRAALELVARPEQVRGARAGFPDTERAAVAVADAVASGVDLAKAELLDPTATAIAADHLDAALPATPTVFLAFHADHGIDRAVERCESAFEEHGVERFETAGRDRMDDLWAARAELAPAIEAHDPDRGELHPGDVTVPIGEYAVLVGYVRERAAEAGLTVPCFGHAGDGNLHYSVLVDRDDPAEVERGEAVYRDVVERALELGGTATGEHGVGLGKRRYMPAEHGDALGVMRSVKEALDPNGTLNPGKVFPPREGEDRGN